jgi:hypothetical protein
MYVLVEGKLRSSVNLVIAIMDNSCLSCCMRPGLNVNNEGYLPSPYARHRPPFPLSRHSIEPGGFTINVYDVQKFFSLGQGEGTQPPSLPLSLSQVV